MEGKLEELKAVCARRNVEFEWSFLLDAFQAERDQAITEPRRRSGSRPQARNYVIIDAPATASSSKNMISRRGLRRCRHPFVAHRRGRQREQTQAPARISCTSWASSRSSSLPTRWTCVGLQRMRASTELVERDHGLPVGHPRLPPYSIIPHRCALRRQHRCCCWTPKCPGTRDLHAARNAGRVRTLSPPRPSAPCASRCKTFTATTKSAEHRGPRRGGQDPQG